MIHSGVTPKNAILLAMTHSLAGGLREIWNDLAEGLDARGHVVGRFVFYPPDDSPALGHDLMFWHHLVGRRPRSPIEALSLFFALVRFLRHKRPAAVVTAMPAANVLVPLAVTVARVPTRVFVTHHSPIETHHGRLNQLDGWTASLKCVAAVISVSDAVGTSLDRKPAAYLAKRRTIHNALPERIELLIDGVLRSGQGADGEMGSRAGNRIVAVGRLTRQKNYPMLLRAVALVPDVTLDILGAGEDEAALRTLAVELGIARRVDFVGLLSREAALARAASADMFVQVSLYEGHSLALIEAARLALPLIVSDVAEQVEAITAACGRRCALVVPLDDVDALAKQIRALAADPAMRAVWSGQARRLAAESSHRAMIDRYEKILVGEA